MSVGLELSVDRTSEVPLGTQLIWKLRTLIATGALPPNARVPGIREVAESAGVNVNTVRTVFARLEEQGLLVSEHGRGTFVAESARLDSNLTHAAEATIAKAHASGVDPRELAAALYVSPRVPFASAAARDLAESDPSALAVTTAEDRGERRSLYRQIDRLERAVGRLDPLSSLERRPRKEALPRVLTTAELRDVRDDLAARVEQLHDERQEWRAETAQLLAAERERAGRGSARRWRAGIWTGRSGADVSWTTA